MIENEIQADTYENFNQKFLVNEGVRVTFLNAFSSNGESKLPTIKPKLRKILVDFGLCQTCLEIHQELGIIQVWYKDEQSAELKGLLLQKYNDNKKASQAIGVCIDLYSCSAPKVSRPIRTYTGLTKLLYQEFISEPRSYSLVDDNPFNEMKTIIQKGNLSPSEPLQSIFRGEVG